jgi:hypothetical protein
MNIYFNALTGGKVVVRIKITSELTWSYKYNITSDKFETGSIVDPGKPEFEIGTPENLKNKKNNWDINFATSSDDTNRDYDVIIEWVHIDDSGKETKLDEWKRNKTTHPLPAIIKIPTFPDKVSFYKEKL